MKVLLVVTPTPGFKFAVGRFESIFAALEETISQGVCTVEFLRASTEVEVIEALPQADCSVVYFHATWLSNPKSPGTVDGLDIFRLVGLLKNRPGTRSVPRTPNKAFGLASG